MRVSTLSAPETLYELAEMVTRLQDMGAPDDAEVADENGNRVALDVGWCE